MNKISLPVFLLLALIFLQGCSPPAPSKALEVNGPPSEKLDIVLVPSHYYGPNAGGNSQWVKDAEAIRTTLLDHHFWKNYRNKINMYRLDASIADDFMQSGANWVPDQEKIKAFALENFPALDFNQNDQIIFVIESVAHKNDPKYISGLTSGHPNIVQLETDEDVLLHEFGHSFGKLGDEYGVKVSIPDWKSPYPNVATLQSGYTCDDKWKDLNKVVIKAPGTWIEGELLRISRIVECFDNTQPGSASKAFRPTNDACIMRTDDDAFPFCPVCQRQLVTLLNKYTPADKVYNQVEIFQMPAEFVKATINPAVIDFDQTGALDAQTGKPLSLTPPSDIAAPPLGLPGGRVYGEAGVSFTAGVIAKEPVPNVASPPNVLRASTAKERALIAGYFFSKRICAMGIYNTGLTSVTIRTYNAAFLETGKAAFVSNADTKTFIGIRATGPIYRFEIDAPSANGFSVDNLYFGECPKVGCVSDGIRSFFRLD